jgi:hydrogenase maturation protease
VSPVAPPLSAGGTLVIGIGNTLRGDDGVGWHLAAELAEGVPVRCLHQLTPELAEDLAPLERVLFIDAWLAPAGATPCLQPVTAGGSEARESHRLEPAQLLALAEVLFGAAPRATELLVPAFAFPHGEALSTDLQRSLPAARLLVRQWLALCHA